jgi:hypothetical protein
MNMMMISNLLGNSVDSMVDDFTLVISFHVEDGHLRAIIGHESCSNGVDELFWILG